MYARFGIPITFFFTSVHRDYHQVTDEPQYIDYNKYARIVNLIHDIAERVADLDHRPVVDKPKPNPTAPCVA
jgi:CO dehydrogenase/acetyl-CoA synthase alpha subunit